LQENDNKINEFKIKAQLVRRISIAQYASSVEL